MKLIDGTEFINDELAVGKWDSGCSYDSDCRGDGPSCGNSLWQ